MRLFDLEQLRSLVAVIEEGSLSGAAPRLNRSQSALSEQIQKLEAFAGVALVQRSKKGMSPTPAGERLLIHARDMLAASEHALEDIRGIRFMGELRFAITDYFRPNAIAEILKRIKGRYPRLRLRVIICRDVTADVDCENESFDIGLSMRTVSEPEGFDAQALRREPLIWTAAADLRFEGGAVPLLVLSDGCALDRYARQRLDAHGMPYFIAHSASGVAGLQSALVAGLGVACLNASAVPTCMTSWQTPQSFPGLDNVEFVLTPPRAKENTFVSEIRDLLLSQLF